MVCKMAESLEMIACIRVEGNTIFTVTKEILEDTCSVGEWGNGSKNSES